MKTTWEFSAVGCEGQRIYGTVEAETEEEARKLIAEAIDESHIVRWLNPV